MIASSSFAGIDFESAGAAKGKTDVPVQIGMGTWSISEGYQNLYVSFIRADRPITWSAQKVHGITTDDLSDAPPMMMLWPVVKKTLSQRVVVAHGYGTEKRYLRAFPAHGFGPWIDTLLLSRAAWPDLPSHALGSLCCHFKLQDKITSLVPNKTWHDALYDAVASLVLLEFLIKEFHLEQSPIDYLLHPDTSIWHRQRH